MGAEITRGMELQKALSKWILDHGINQAAISRATGIRKHRINDIVNFKTDMRSSELWLICCFLDKKPSEILATIEKEE